MNILLNNYFEQVKYLSEKNCRHCKTKKCVGCDIHKQYCKICFEIVRTSEQKEELKV